MAKFKCAYCGCIFDEEDAGRRTEHEEVWGAPCSITYNTCPSCGEDISEEDEYEEDDEEEEAENDDKCNGCYWNYNGICTCSGVRPCDYEEAEDDTLN